MSRRAPRYYGNTSITSNDTDLPEVAAHVYMCPREKVLKVPDKMNWYVKKGAAIEPSQASFFRHVRITPDREPCFVFSTILYACDGDDAPGFKWQNPNGTPSFSPLFIQLIATAVYQVCTLTADLSCIPRYKFSIFTNSEGVQFWHVNYKHQMTLVNEVSEVLCERGNGKRNGS